MTRDEILNMKPGRELDALVAEKVMGYRVYTQSYPSIVEEKTVEVEYIEYQLENETIRGILPHYSTDNAAALEVAIHLQKQGYYVCIDLKACEETSVGVYEENPAEQIAYAKAQTPAEAISKAALLAVMEWKEFVEEK